MSPISPSSIETVPQNIPEPSTTITQEEEAQTEPIEQQLEANKSLLTYENSSLGISFSYPPGFIVQTSDNHSLSIWTEEDYANQDDFIEAIPLTLGFDPNPKQLSALAWVQDHNFLITGDLTPQTIADREGVMFSWEGMWFYTSIVVPTSDQNEVLIMTLDDYSEQENPYKLAFETILATINIR
jgi:hypothetical protein